MTHTSQILVANKYKSDAARFAAEGAKAEAKRMAHELALSHIEGLQQIKQSAVKDAALQKDFLVSEKEKAETASAVLRAEQEQTKAMRHEYAVARAESLHVIKQNAVATAAKEREALASAQRQAIQVLRSRLGNVCCGGNTVPGLTTFEDKIAIKTLVGLLLILIDCMYIFIIIMTVGDGNSSGPRGCEPGTKARAVVSPRRWLQVQKMARSQRGRNGVEPFGDAPRRSRRREGKPSQECRSRQAIAA